MMGTLAVQVATHGQWIEPKLTLDGLLTFVGGGLAFLAIWRQTRHADQGLEKQFDEERQRRSDELEQRRKAIARALLAEIDDFYRYYVRDVRKKLPESQELQLPGVRLIPSASFPIYHGSIGQLGYIAGDVLSGLVQLYSVAEIYLNNFRELKEWTDKIGQGKDVDVAIIQARRLISEVRASLPHVERAIHVACEALCLVACVPFESPAVAVAAAGLSTEMIRADLGCGSDKNGENA